MRFRFDPRDHHILTRDRLNWISGAVPPPAREIGEAVGLSQFHLQRAFKKWFGESPLQMIARLQIGRAKELLVRGVPAPEVARRCGFSNQSHFTTRFKQATGTTPMRWLRSHHRSKRKPRR